jgi:NADPH-dependent curcumin reductase CurA
MIAVRVRYISIDPMLRVWISGAKTYLPALVPGSSIPGFGCGQVIKINDSSNRMNKPEVGEYVFGTFEWSEIMICSIKQAQKIPIVIYVVN